MADPFRFTLRQLENFVAIVEHGSISAAARALNLSQAAVSESLAGLERAAGSQLLVRSRTHGVTLTSSGTRILAETRSLIARAVELQVTMDERTGELAGPLAIGLYRASSPFWMPFIAAEFITAHSGLTVSTVEGNGQELQRRLLAGQLDAVITHSNHLVDGIRNVMIAPGHGYIAVAADHRLALAGRESASFAELAEEDYVLLDVEWVRDHQMPRLRAAGLDPRVRWRSADLETVRGLIARGLGWSVLVQRPPVASSYEGRGLAHLEVEDPYRASDICIAYGAGEPSARVRALIAACVAEGRRRAAAEGYRDEVVDWIGRPVEGAPDPRGPRATRR